MPQENSNPNDPLSGLLGALIGGHPAVQDHMQKTGQSLDQVLASMSNAAPSSPNTGATRGSFGDLLGMTMGNASDTGNAPKSGAGGDALSGILGGLLGGQVQPGGASQPGASGDPLSSILGGLLGGGMPTSGASQPSDGGDPISGILGGLLGGGMQGGTPNEGAVNNNTFLAPIVQAIAGKIGIPPEIAMTVASFALAQLMGGQRDPHLAQTLSGKGIVSQKYLRDSGLVSQLVEQTGLDKKTATASLQQVMQAFGTQMGEGSTTERQQNLKGWLEG